MALAAITNDGYGFTLDQTQVTVLVVKNFHLFSEINSGDKRPVTKNTPTQGRR
jgi:hypothetical protein